MRWTWTLLLCVACGGSSYQPSPDRLPVGEWAMYGATDFGNIALGLNAKPLGDLDFSRGPVPGGFADVSVALEPAEWGSDGSDWIFSGAESVDAGAFVVHFTGGGGMPHTLSVTTMDRGVFLGTLDERAIRASAYSE